MHAFHDTQIENLAEKKERLSIQLAEIRPLIIIHLFEIF